jgi:hypothetical protein
MGFLEIAIEAVLRTGGPGQIIWDVDWVSYDG